MTSIDAIGTDIESTVEAEKFTDSQKAELENRYKEFFEVGDNVFISDFIDRTCGASLYYSNSNLHKPEYSNGNHIIKRIDHNYINSGRTVYILDNSNYYLPEHLIKIKPSKLPKFRKINLIAPDKKLNSKLSPKTLAAIKFIAAKFSGQYKNIFIGPNHNLGSTISILPVDENTIIVSNGFGGNKIDCSKSDWKKVIISVAIGQPKKWSLVHFDGLVDTKQNISSVLNDINLKNFEMLISNLKKRIDYSVNTIEKFKNNIVTNQKDIKGYKKLIDFEKEIKDKIKLPIPEALKLKIEGARNAISYNKEKIKNTIRAVMEEGKNIKILNSEINNLTAGYKPFVLSDTIYENIIKLKNNKVIESIVKIDNNLEITFPAFTIESRCNCGKPCEYSNFDATYYSGRIQMILHPKCPAENCENLKFCNLSSDDKYHVHIGGNNCNQFCLGDYNDVIINQIEKFDIIGLILTIKDFLSKFNLHSQYTMLTDLKNKIRDSNNIHKIETKDNSIKFA